jgi:serine/threonine kinase 16
LRVLALAMDSAFLRELAGDARTDLAGLWRRAASGAAKLRDSVQGTVAAQLGERVPGWAAPLVGAEAEWELRLGARRLLVGRRLGEGGYSFVYAARDAPPDGGGAAAAFDPFGAAPPPPLPQPLPRQYALKKMLAGSPEVLAEAQQEVEVARRLTALRHPNLLPLLDAAVERAAGADAAGGATHVVYMLLPLAAGGTLFDAASERPAPAGDALAAFAQLCDALAAMHAAGLAHRDVKPHNVLLERGGGVGLAPAPAARPPPPPPSRGCPLDELAAARGPVFAAPPLAAPTLAAPPARGGGAAAAAGPLAGARALLMDFGSAGPSRLAVATRAAALAAQEDAARRCSAPYRAPELWDVPSACVLDERADIWSAGCVLYFLLVGESPFERAGGSLMLAACGGRYAWPAGGAAVPRAAAELVAACLALDPAARPGAAAAAATARRALAEVEGAGRGGGGGLAVAQTY